MWLVTVNEEIYYDYYVDPEDNFKSPAAQIMFTGTEEEVKAFQKQFGLERLEKTYAENNITIIRYVTYNKVDEPVDKFPDEFMRENRTEYIPTKEIQNFLHDGVSLTMYEYNKRSK